MKNSVYAKKALQAMMIAAAMGAVSASAEPWSFGVMSDTQWKNYPGGQNTVATGIIDQLNLEFIAHDVDFVVQCGDLDDSYSAAAFTTRAAATQALYDAGIGFYPLRGNHESSSSAAVQFQSLFPQTTGQGANALPAAVNFSSPAAMPGLSYSFDYKGATLVLLDQFNRPDNTSQSVLGQDQVDWVESVLSQKPAGHNAFVFAHKGLITENHADILFGSNPSSAPALQNQFMSSLFANDVRFLFGGHDHMHNRAIITSPDGLSQVQDITTSSNSYKFYVPKTGASIVDIKYNLPAFGFLRETPISQELFTVGYYIVTVDGPRVTVDHWAAPNGCDGDCDLMNSPSLTGNFTKRESFGYSLNGQEFVIQPGDSFAGISDTSPNTTGYLGTSMEILGGINTVSSSLYDGRATVQDINTGWISKEEEGDAVQSDVLSLWGMHNSLGSEQTDTFVLSMSYNAGIRGALALGSKDSVNGWVHATDGNSVGNAKFIVGPWKAGYSVGTYGVDPASHTTWAVIDHASDFAVIASTDGDLDGDGDVDKNDVNVITANRNKKAEVLPAADLDGDGIITVLDARKEMLICSLPGCAIQ